MSPLATPGDSSDTETSALLPAFVNVLESTDALTIPSETLLGAISHFLSNLDDEDLPRLVEVVIASSAIWDSQTVEVDHIRQAIRAAVTAKVARVDQYVKDVYFAASRRKRMAQSWVRQISSLVSRSERAHERSRLHVHAGLLVGLDDVPDLDWGAARVKLEESVIYDLAGLLEGDDGDTKEVVQFLCEVMPHLNDGRLRVLDMEKITTRLQTHLAHSVRESPLSQAEASSASRALARSFEVLHSGGPASRHHAIQAMKRFCETSRQMGKDLEREWDAAGVRSEESDLWVSHKVAFFSFLLPASSILDIVLASPADEGATDSETGRPLNIMLVVELLRTLANYAYLTDAAKDGFGYYHRILYGSLDVLAEQGGVDGTDQLFEALLSDGRGSAARAALLLVIGEELAYHLSSRSVTSLLALAEAHIHQTSHRASFEAAHSFLLALLRSASESLDTITPQRDFFDALLPNYLASLTKHASRGDLQPETLKVAFPLVVECAARRSPASVNLCLSQLASLRPSPETRFIRIALTPHIPAERVPSYLDDLASMILDTPRDSEERLDLSRRAFEMVIKDLGDEVKGLGVEWWSSHREGFEGRERDTTWLRSRL
ncbi:hypothetical protein IAU60_005272 [Kwoniella sp. DSM 27419]